MVEAYDDQSFDESCVEAIEILFLVNAASIIQKYYRKYRKRDWIYL